MIKESYDENVVDLVVIDDLPHITRFVKKACNYLGYNCVEYSETRTCIKDIEESNIAPKAYLVDMRIPNDLQGSESLFFYLKNNNKLMKFYYMTGNLSEHDLEVIKKTQTPFLLKPFSIKELEEILK